MATVRAGTQGVLLVVDVQVGVMRDAWDAARVVRNVARVVERARTAGVPVLWVQHADDGLVRDGPDWQLVPELVPAAGEARVHKSFHSAFEETTLEPALAGLGATHVVLAGAESIWCIRATAYGALERGYDLTLVSDAHTAVGFEFDGTRIEPAGVVADLNAAMTGLSYPGRANATATAEAVVFDGSAARR